jgi:hypothetical protein
VKRTVDQAEFDNTLHGWAFCDVEMLENKIRRAEKIYARMGQDEERRERLDKIRAVARDMASNEH